MNIVYGGNDLEELLDYTHQTVFPDDPIGRYHSVQYLTKAFYALFYNDIPGTDTIDDVILDRLEIQMDTLLGTLGFRHADVNILGIQPELYDYLIILELNDGCIGKSQST